MNKENAEKIEQYIEQNPNSKLPNTLSVIIKGKSKNIPVYKLPLDLLFYNIKNGRFAAEYSELKKKIGRELKTHSNKDKQIIQQMLLDLDSKKSFDLENDIRKFGQREPGICTFDGNVHNGNRRMSVVQNIVDTGDLKFNYLNVAILPPEVTDQELWLIEAGIQLSKNIQEPYGAINTLLKFKEGIESGLTPLQVTKNLYGFDDEKEIIDKLELLKLIVKYLKFVGEPDHYKKADGIVEHFIDLNTVLKKAKRDGASITELIAYQNIGFQLIHDGISQRTLRKLKDIITREKSKQQLLSALEYSRPESSAKKMERKIKADEEEGLTLARIIFNKANDTVESIKNAKQPLINLERAFGNFDNIDENNNSVRSKEFQALLSRIEMKIKKLKK